MGKQLISTRLLKLMEGVKWQGRDNWTKLPTQIQEENILEFKVWVRKSLGYLKQDNVKRDFERYYFNGESDDTGTGFYIRLDQARSALAAVYQMEQEALDGYRTGNQARTG